jgi:lysyl-tRNA synthetase class 1
MLKRFVGTRTISILDVPSYMTEFDELEDIYFGKKQIDDKKELAKLSGLYSYCWWLKPPKQNRVHVPFNLLAFLGKVAPKGAELDYLTEKLREYGYLEKTESLPTHLHERIQYAANWNRDFAEISETKAEVSVQERRAIEDLALTLEAELDADQIQTAIFDAARNHRVEPKQFFKTLYAILLGSPAGPRLGPYIVAMGKRNVVDALKRALRD